MKTVAVEVDEAKVENVMRISGIATKEAAVDFALREAERICRLEQMLAEPLVDYSKGDVVDPKYDVLMLRELEKPRP